MNSAWHGNLAAAGNRSAVGDCPHLTNGLRPKVHLWKRTVTKPVHAVPRLLSSESGLTCGARCMTIHAVESPKRVNIYFLTGVLTGRFCALRKAINNSLHAPTILNDNRPMSTDNTENLNLRVQATRMVVAKRGIAT